MLTIKEIAEMAGVSRTTVSRVLNDSGYVSDEARKRVVKVIEETGYIPSQQAKSLRTKKTKVIGVVIPKLGTETSGRLVNGMNEVFSKYGYQILLTSSNLEPQKEIEYLRLLKSRQVDGIILSATTISDELITEIHQLKMPFVAVGQNIPGVANVIYDDFNASKAMTGLLIERGRKNIAFIGVPESDQAVGIERKQGFIKQMEKHNLLIRPEWMAIADFSITSGYHAMSKIIENAAGWVPDGVFCVTDRMAIGAMQYLKEAGHRVPDDISVAGIGASDISKYFQPALTTMDYENEVAGQEAAQILLAQIEKSENFQKTITLNGRLIERDSI
ncbi:LacI family DNA-binding transcriptional regulator [Mesobacillus harenae]|uniref:LacI family DNA-binding transcriptional regulator n=1 Tax=Mesobacillus harenae TaxID=2213203 RepID=UPI001580222A|nr:LacI family DNA-binding transcriptional regulator [Mesobacillus harenae]